MAGKARLLSDIISKILASNEVNEEDSSLKAQMNAFKKFLIHDITLKILQMFIPNNHLRMFAALCMIQV